MDLGENLQILPVFAVNNCIEIKNMFDQNKVNLGVDYSFEYLVSSSHVYCTYKNNDLISVIYYFHDQHLEEGVRKKFCIPEGGGGKLLFMNGFSKRKSFLENRFTVLQTAKYYKSNIYSCTNKRAAMYLLLSVGFKKIHCKNCINSDYSLFMAVNEYKNERSYPWD